MSTERKINEDYLLLLVDNNNLIETKMIDITKHFGVEMGVIENFCGKSGDNIDEITSYIKKALIPKYQPKQFKYSIELDKAFNTVFVDLNAFVVEIDFSQKRIFEEIKTRTEKEKEKEKPEVDFEKKLDEWKEQELKKLKARIVIRIKHYFNAFDIEIAYSEAEKVSNMLAYSHRYGGWKTFEHNITENLKQTIKTNFGYGSVSYFYSVLTYKGIEIIPLSDWIDYRFANFSELLRYTRSFRYLVPICDERDRLRCYKTVIKNEYWVDALDFTKNAANLSFSDEDKFIEKYIIEECETMVQGLEHIYNEHEFDLLDLDENEISISIKEKEEMKRKKYNFSGFELIDFRTEKIIGALDFIQKIMEYNAIIPTEKYIKRISAVNKKFIPNVYNARNEESVEFKKVSDEYEVFLVGHQKLIKINEFYEKKKTENQFAYNKSYAAKHSEIVGKLANSTKTAMTYKNKIELHKNNLDKLDKFITKYKEWEEKETSR